MARALVVRNISRTLDVVSLLSRMGLEVSEASSCQQARAMILDMDFNLVVIQPPLVDGGGRELATMASSQSSLDVVLLANASQVEALSSGLGKLGVYVVSRLIGPEEFTRTISVLQVARGRMAALEDKNARLLRRLSEERKLSEVKCLLALRLEMSEEEAHHFIEKKAMDERIGLADAADLIRRQLEDRR